MLRSCRKKGGACLQCFGHVERRCVLTMLWSCRKKGEACLQCFGHVERREEHTYSDLVM